jgi:hypothetical protein
MIIGGTTVISNNNVRTEVKNYTTIDVDGGDTALDIVQKFMTQN